MKNDETSDPKPSISERLDRLRRVLVQPTLDLYVLRRYAFLYVGNLVCFTLVYVLLDIFENLQEFASQAESIAELVDLCVRYYATTIPAVFCQLLGPVVALTAGLFTVTLFHRSNELVPMLANGRPFWRISMPILAAGLIASAATFAVQELWLPRMAQSFRAVSGAKENKEVLTNQMFHDSARGILVVVRRYQVLAKQGEGITVVPLPGYARRTPGQVEYYIWAQSMLWVKPELEDKGYWLLEGAQVQTYDPLWREKGTSNLIPPPHRGTSQSVPLLYDSRPLWKLDTSLIPEDIQAKREDVAYMSLSTLRRKLSDSIDRRWAVQFYQRLAAPLGAFVLLCVGLPLSIFFGARNIFFGGLLAALVACVYILSGSMTTSLAQQGFLPVSLGGWLPFFVFTALGWTWLRGQ
jgi:lipopolysaccharide export system permease protein